MSGKSVTKDTACRSLGFVNNPPRGYFRTVKTCHSATSATKPNRNTCTCGCFAKGTYTPNIEAVGEFGSSPNEILVIVQNAVFTRCTDVVSASVGFIVLVPSLVLTQEDALQFAVDLPFPIETNNFFEVLGNANAFESGQTTIEIHAGIVKADIVTSPSRALVVIARPLDPVPSPPESQPGVVQFLVCASFQYCLVPI